LLFRAKRKRRMLLLVAEIQPRDGFEFWLGDSVLDRRYQRLDGRLSIAGHASRQGIGTTAMHLTVQIRPRPTPQSKPGSQTAFAAASAA